MFKKVLTSLSLVALVFVFVLVPLDISVAQDSAPDETSSFVTCDGTSCSFCNLVEMANIIIIWLFGILFLIFAVIMFVAGFGLVTAGGNEVALDAAKKKFQNALIGIIIIMAAWLLIDTIMKGLLTDGELKGWGPWSHVECQTQTPAIQYEKSDIPYINDTPPDNTINAACTDDAALMAKYKGSPVGLVDPALTAMISCYMGFSDISSITDSGQLYTTDRSYPRCSLTNGNQVCGKCSHSNNSKHYGRGSGQGAQAVDFNAKGSSESELFNKIKARQGQCGGSVLFEGDHTHISL